MGAKYTEAQAKASKKYVSQFVTINFRVTEEQRTKYKERAMAYGMSLSQYIISRLESDN